MGGVVVGVGLRADRGPGATTGGAVQGVEDGLRPAPVPTAASGSTVSFKVHEFVQWAPSIHISIQQRNGRKTLTSVQGITGDYNKMKLVNAFKMKFACNGTVIEHPEYEEVIQLQGDQRKNICQFLVETRLTNDDHLKVHAFLAH
ncbi:Eukaryotic translation initiation factor 1 [Myotis davidii]|uniref:Eukaryotic translation initiation factor 1 n=1 Tax=Myotis davidii TaxID=225400 RepID=L5M3I7_MYODS|nr:Eukaryotic translation initiation factor 1 [Myotis davidii]